MRQLVNRIEDVVAALYPDAVIKGGIAYCSAKSSKDLGSFQVYLTHNGRYERGSWHRWSAGIGGSPINLIAYALTNNHTGKASASVAFEWAKKFLGMKTWEETENDRLARERRAAEAQAAKQRHEAEEARNRAARVETASEIWRACKPISGPGLAYLRSRIGDEDFSDPDLRLHEGLRHPEGKTYPAVVSLVRGPDGKPQGIWRIYIRSDGSGKAPVQNAKLGLGPASGGAVRLGGLSPRIGIAEGVETALAASILSSRRRPVWAGLSTSGLIGFQCPKEVEDVTIYADADEPHIRNGRIVRPGVDAAEQLKKRLIDEGKTARVSAPPMGMDFLDLLRYVGKD